MGAPSTTQRQLPEGAYLRDGFRSLLAFANDPTLPLWEDIDGGVKPPGVSGGDKIPTTTMHSNTYRTFASRQLKTLTDGSMTCGYDTKALPRLVTLTNWESAITQHFPDDSTLDFWGFMQDVEFDPLVEGEMPSCTVTIAVTNTDPSDGSEAGWVMTEGTGTY